MSTQNPENQPVSAAESDVQHVEVQPGVHEITIGETRESAVSKAQAAIEEKAADSLKRVSVTGNLPETQAFSQGQAAKLQEAKAAALAKVGEVLRGATDAEMDMALEGLRDRVPRPGETFADRTTGVPSAISVEAPTDASTPSIELENVETVNLPAGIAETALALGDVTPEDLKTFPNINTLLRSQMEMIKPGSYNLALQLNPGGLARILRSAFLSWEKHDSEQANSLNEKITEFAQQVGGQRRVEANAFVTPLTTVFQGLPNESPLMGQEGTGFLALALKNQEFAQKVADLALTKGAKFGAVLDRMAKENGVQATVGSLQRLLEGNGRGFDEQESFFSVKDNMLPTLLSDAKLMGILSQPDSKKKIYDLSVQSSPETVAALLSVLGRQISDDPTLFERALHPLVFHELAATVEGSMESEYDVNGKKMSVAQRIRNLVDTGKELAEVVRQRLPQGVPTTQKFPRAQA